MKKISILLILILAGCADYNFTGVKKGTENTSGVSLKPKESPQASNKNSNQVNQVNSETSNNTLSDNKDLSGVSTKPVPSVSTPITPQTPVSSVPVKKIEELQINQKFNFENTSEYSLKIKVIDNTGQAMDGILLGFYIDDPDENGVILTQGVTDSNGIFEKKIKIPAYKKEVYLKTDYLGLPSKTLLPLNSTEINYTLGG